VRDDLEARRFVDRDAGDRGAARRRERTGSAKRGRYDQDLGEAFFHIFVISAVSRLATLSCCSMVQWGSLAALLRWRGLRRPPRTGLGVLLCNDQLAFLKRAQTDGIGVQLCVASDHGPIEGFGAFRFR